MHAQKEHHGPNLPGSIDRSNEAAEAGRSQSWLIEGGKRDPGQPSHRGVWGRYLKALATWPVTTKACTAGVLNAVGDICSQTVVEHTPQLDLKRLAIFSFVGFAVVGPVLHYFYLALSRAIQRPGVVGGLMRVACDQLLFAPFFIAAIFSIIDVLQGDAEVVATHLHQNLPSVILTNWKLWIPVNFLNFAFVPQHLQVLTANVVAVPWSVYLSYASHAHS